MIKNFSGIGAVSFSLFILVAGCSRILHHPAAQNDRLLVSANLGTIPTIPPTANINLQSHLTDSFIYSCMTNETSDGKSFFLGKNFSEKGWLSVYLRTNGGSIVEVKKNAYDPELVWGDCTAGDLNGDGQADFSAKVISGAHSVGTRWAMISRGNFYTVSLILEGRVSQLQRNVQYLCQTNESDGKAFFMGRQRVGDAYSVFLFDRFNNKMTTVAGNRFHPNLTWGDCRAGYFNNDNQLDFSSREPNSRTQWSVVSTPNGYQMVTAPTSTDIAVGDRVATIHYPPDFSQSSYPVVIALHGGGGNRDEFLYDALLDQEVTKSGMLLVLAEGVPTSVINGKPSATWNAGRCCGPNAAIEGGPDDIGYLRQLIDTITNSTYKADPKRIFLTGISNGAQMSYKAACELPDKIAGIAPVAGVGMYDNVVKGKFTHDHCSNLTQGRPITVPTFHIHGTSDLCAPYKGGKGGDCFRKFFFGLGIWVPPITVDVVEGAQDFFRYWTGAMGYAVQTNTTSSGGVTCYDFSNKAGGPTVNRFCALQNVGHVWAGGEYGEACRKGADSKVCEAWRNAVTDVTNPPRPGDRFSAPFEGFRTTSEIIRFFKGIK